MTPQQMAQMAQMNALSAIYNKEAEAVRLHPARAVIADDGRIVAQVVLVDVA